MSKSLPLIVICCAVALAACAPRGDAQRPGGSSSGADARAADDVLGAGGGAGAGAPSGDPLETLRFGPAFDAALDRWVRRCGSFTTADCRQQRADLLVDLSLTLSAADAVSDDWARSAERALRAVAGAPEGTRVQLAALVARLVSEDLSAVGATAEQLTRALVLTQLELVGDELDSLLVEWAELGDDSGPRARVAVAALLLPSLRTWSRLGSTEPVGSGLIADCGFLCSLERGRGVTEAAELLGYLPGAFAPEGRPWLDTATNYLDAHQLLALDELLRRLARDRERGVRVAIAAAPIAATISRELDAAAVPGELAPVAWLDDPQLQLAHQLFATSDVAAERMAARPALRVVAVTSGGVRVALRPALGIDREQRSVVWRDEQATWDWPGRTAFAFPGLGGWPLASERETTLPSLRAAVEGLHATLEEQGWPAWVDGSPAARRVSVLIDRETPWFLLGRVLRTLDPLAEEGMTLHLWNSARGSLSALPVATSNRPRPGAARLRVRADGFVLEHSSLSGAQLVSLTDREPLLTLHRAVAALRAASPDRRLPPIDVIPEDDRVDWGLIARALELLSWERDVTRSVTTDARLLRAPIVTVNTVPQYLCPEGLRLVIGTP